MCSVLQEQTLKSYAKEVLVLAELDPEFDLLEALDTFNQLDKQEGVWQELQ